MVENELSSCMILPLEAAIEASGAVVSGAGSAGVARLLNTPASCKISDFRTDGSVVVETSVAIKGTWLLRCRDLKRTCKTL